MLTTVSAARQITMPSTGAANGAGFEWTIFIAARLRRSFVLLAQERLLVPTSGGTMTSGGKEHVQHVTRIDTCCTFAE